MSKLSRKTALAFSVAAAFAFTAPAMAASIDDGAGSPYSTVVATTDLGALSTITLNDLGINIQGTDQIIGRTTGFGIRITLQAGATFDSTVVPATGPGAAGWTATLGAGGNAGDNYVVISMNPGAPGDHISADQILLLSGMQITNAGSTVPATIEFFDPVSTQNILSPINFNIMTSASPLAFSISGGDTLSKIDVGSQNFPSKTGFSTDGTVNGPHSTVFDAGNVNIGVAAGVNQFDGNPFHWDANPPDPQDDMVHLTLEGNFAAFNAAGGSIVLSDTACTAQTNPIPATIAGGVADFGNQIYSDVNGDFVCFNAPGNVVIDATDVVGKVTATRTQFNTTVTGQEDALPLRYNGPVEIVYTFNPASNTTMQSFLRVSNTGSTAGKITIDGRDDTGATAGPITFTLGGHESIHLTAQDLENGNAAKGLTGSLGDGAGKWILTVTGEVATMEVTNLNRSLSSDQLNNLGTPVTGHYKPGE